MPPPIDFLALIERVRSGDEAASAELVRRFEPFIQRVVRIRMGRRGQRGPLGHDAGSSDVCQSIFRSLFQGLRNNRYRLDQPGDLEKLLQVMIRFNVATKARLAGVKLRELIDDFEQAGWMDSGLRPDQKVAEQDLIEAIQAQFSEEELELLTLWLDDTPWATIGQKLGCSGDGGRAGATDKGHRTESGRKMQRGGSRRSMKGSTSPSSDRRRVASSLDESRRGPPGPPRLSVGLTPPGGVRHQPNAAEPQPGAR